MNLQYEVIPYGLWTEKEDAETGKMVPGLGTTRFYRFEGKVKFEKLVIPKVAARIF